MRWMALLALALLLGGCATRTMPSLEDASPTAQVSTAPGTRSVPNLEDIPPTAQASTAPVTRSIPNLEDVPPTAQASTAPRTATNSGRAAGQSTDQQSAKTSSVTGPAVQSDEAVEPPATTTAAIDTGRRVKLTAQQRSDIERGVQHGLAGSNPAEFGPMAATISKVTSKSYIVCGWVKGGDSAGGYRPFLAMYVPYMRTALLVAISGKQTEAAIRERCVDEGVPLPS